MDILVNKNWNAPSGSIFSFLAFVIEVKSPDTYSVSVFEECFLKTHCQGIMFNN